MAPGAFAETQRSRPGKQTYGPGTNMNKKHRRKGHRPSQRCTWTRARKFTGILAPLNYRPAVFVSRSRILLAKLYRGGPTNCSWVTRNPSSEPEKDHAVDLTWKFQMIGVHGDDMLPACAAVANVAEASAISSASASEKCHPSRHADPRSRLGCRPPRLRMWSILSTLPYPRVSKNLGLLITSTKVSLAWEVHGVRTILQKNGQTAT